MNDNEIVTVKNVKKVCSLKDLSELNLSKCTMDYIRSQYGSLELAIGNIRRMHLEKKCDSPWFIEATEALDRAGFIRHDTDWFPVYQCIISFYQIVFAGKTFSMNYSPLNYSPLDYNLFYELYPGVTPGIIQRVIGWVGYSPISRYYSYSCRRGEVINLLYGLTDGKPKTVTEVAGMCGLKTKTIENIRDHVIQDLREYRPPTLLDDYRAIETAEKLLNELENLLCGASESLKTMGLLNMKCFYESPEFMKVIKILSKLKTIPLSFYSLAYSRREKFLSGLASIEMGIIELPISIRTRKTLILNGFKTVRDLVNYDPELLLVVVEDKKDPVLRGENGMLIEWRTDKDFCADLQDKTRREIDALLSGRIEFHKAPVRVVPLEEMMDDLGFARPPYVYDKLRSIGIEYSDEIPALNLKKVHGIGPKGIEKIRLSMSKLGYKTIPLKEMNFSEGCYNELRCRGIEYSDEILSEYLYGGGRWYVDEMYKIFQELGYDISLYY